MLKAIFFDLDNTLCDCRKADEITYGLTMEFASKKCPEIDSLKLKNLYMKYIDEKPFDPKGIIPVFEWRTNLWNDSLIKQKINNINLAKLINNFFYTNRLKYFKFDPGVEDMLSYLAKKYKLALITNGDSEIQRPKVESCEAENFFGKNILIGGDYSEEKPHVSIFQKACNMVSCKPDEAIHIGDSIDTDIIGGINAGLKATVLVKHDTKPINSDRAKPDYVIDNVCKLIEILDIIE